MAALDVWEDPVLAFLIIAIAYAVVTPMEVLLSGRSSRSRRANLSIILPMMAAVAGADLALVALTDQARHSGIGFLAWLGISGPLAIVSTIFVLDLAAYLGHRLRHRTDLLWRFHRTHHTDPDVDVTTLLRHHPGDVVVLACVSSAGVLLLGPTPNAVAISAAIGAVFGLWTHVRVALPRRFERACSLLVQTPGMHRVHHSPYQPETDSNYGLIFSLWDRLFRSYTPPEPQRATGLDTVDLGERQSLRAMLLEPWRPLVHETPPGAALVALPTTETAQLSRS